MTRKPKQPETGPIATGREAKRRERILLAIMDELHRQAFNEPGKPRTVVYPYAEEDDNRAHLEGVFDLTALADAVYRAASS